MAKKYIKLRMKMVEQDADQAYIAKKLECSPCYVSKRFRGIFPWSMSDAYTICRTLNIPTEQLLTYFPENGISPKGGVPHDL